MYNMEIIQFSVHSGISVSFHCVTVNVPRVTVREDCPGSVFLQGHSSLVSDMSYTPDSGYLVSVSEDTTGKLYAKAGVPRI